MRRQIFSIPNILSYIRFILAFVFAFVYLNAEGTRDYYLAAGIVAVSGLTDCLDGYIARHFHMITELGKIIDPVADKFTQGVLALCLMDRYKLMVPLFIIFLIKESYMGIKGIKVLRISGENHGAMWYGKVSTVVLYGVMLVLIIFPGINYYFANIMIGICILFVLNAFVLYVRRYNTILNENM